MTPTDRPAAAGLYRLTATLPAASALSAVPRAAAVPLSFADPALTDGAGEVVLYNFHDRATAEGSVVWAEPDADGNLWLTDARSCGDLS